MIHPALKSLADREINEINFDTDMGGVQGQDLKQSWVDVEDHIIDRILTESREKQLGAQGISQLVEYVNAEVLRKAGV